MYFLIGMYLGVLLVFIMKARKYITTMTFSFKVWWTENRVRVLWCGIFATMIYFVIKFYPESASALELIGFNMKIGVGESLSPILIGAVVANITYVSSDKKENHVE